MIELSFEPDAVRGADWLELSCLLNYPASISKSVIEAYFERSNFKGPELITADIFKHVRWRKSISANYPFCLTGFSLRAKCSVTDGLEYSFPLLLSTHDFYSDTKITNWDHVGGLFEVFCTASIHQLFGNAVLIGNEVGGFPADFDDCLTEVCKTVNERKGIQHPKAKDFQDAGVDIIAWRDFDQRKGQIVVLVQCASGKNWKKKGGDIKPKLWSQLILWTVDPVKALTFPYAFDFDSIESEDEWIYCAYDAGLLLDRLRLATLGLSESKVDLGPIVEWSKNQVETIKSYTIEH